MLECLHALALLSEILISLENFAIWQALFRRPAGTSGAPLDFCETGSGLRRRVSRSAFASFLFSWLIPIIAIVDLTRFVIPNGRGLPKSLAIVLARSAIAPAWLKTALPPRRTGRASIRTLAAGPTSRSRVSRPQAVVPSAVRHARLLLPSCFSWCCLQLPGMLGDAVWRGQRGHRSAGRGWRGGGIRTASRARIARLARRSPPSGTVMSEAFLTRPLGQTHFGVSCITVPPLVVQ